MRWLAVVFAVLAIEALLAIETLAGGASAEGKVPLAQSSTLTNCMMFCNSQAATCQSGCLVPSSSSSGTTTSTITGANSTASTSCTMNCTTTQITCQTTCAKVSP